MISTEQWPRSSLTQTEPDDPFEQLRAAFHLRLRIYADRESSSSGSGPNFPIGSQAIRRRS